MEIRFEIDTKLPNPNSIDSDVPMIKGNIVLHYNETQHQKYIVSKTKYIVDDCEEQFYQLVSLQPEE